MVEVGPLPINPTVEPRTGKVRRLSGGGTPQSERGRESSSLSLGVIMNDWKAQIGGGGGGVSRTYTGPNGSAEKVDYSHLPLGGSDDEGGGDDWIQRQIRGHKVS